MRRTRLHPASVLMLTAVAFAAGLTGCGGDGDEGASSSSTTTTAAAPTTTTTAAAATTTTVAAPTTTTTTPAPTTTTAAPATTTRPAGQVLVASYFLRHEKLGPVARQATSPAVAAGAMQGLLAGPTATEREIGFTTAIPARTRLHGIALENGIATVDLSAEFASGGGTASIQARVAQVVFTLTQFPSVDAVTFELDGKRLTALGGEGLLLEEPQTRSDWEALSPAILVESPLPFEPVQSPLRIRGTANTFEAVFWIDVVDGEGLIVYDKQVMATSGTGTRGTYDVRATFDVPRPGLGAVIVFEKSPKDGSQRDVVEVPVNISG